MTAGVLEARDDPMIAGCFSSGTFNPDRGKTRLAGSANKIYGIAYSDLTAVISSVITVKLLSVFGPNVVLIATSAASRPLAISTRPMRGMLWRASKVYHTPPR